MSGKRKHIHGKGIFDPNCATCRGTCKCKKSKPSKEHNFCLECLSDLPEKIKPKKIKRN